MASPTVAANAYANLARILDSGGAGKASEAGGPSFGAVLKDAIGSVLEAGKKSDAQTVAMASGKANVMDVVTAVAEPTSRSRRWCRCAIASSSPTKTS